METKGIEKGLTHYSDMAFAVYPRWSFAKSMGYWTELFNKPIVGIASSPSELIVAIKNMRELVEATKRGVLAAVALPIDFPAIYFYDIAKVMIQS